MKAKLLVLCCLITHVIIGQNSITLNNINKEKLTLINTPSEPRVEIKSNGFDFEISDVGINTKYSEFGSGFFRKKLIVVSSKRVGGLAKIDPNTKEAYKNLFCSDVSKNGKLSTPLLFSRILNTNDSEDQLAFTPDQKKVYYTRSSRRNSLEFKLYRATLEEGSHGNWLKNELLNINKNGVTIETPFLNQDGTKLYFSSNMEGTIGGYDIFVSDINEDGTLGTPKNLGHNINTTSDEKYPSTSVDGKKLYFSSKGHKSLGGYDIFVSKILKDNTFKAPLNLGNTLNSSYDEVAFFFASKNKGYVSSNRPNGKGSFDIYTAVNHEVIQSLKGKVQNLEETSLPNTLVILTDENINELDRVTTNEKGEFKFNNIVPFETYTIITIKDGFENGYFDFFANKGFKTTYNTDLKLKEGEGQKQ